MANKNLTDEVTKLTDEVMKMKIQNVAICATLDIQSVDEFLQSSLKTPESSTIGTPVEPAVDAADLIKLDHRNHIND